MQPITNAEPVGAQLIRDLMYAPQEPATSQGHLLDLYLPTGNDAPTPVVIWCHGSAWLQENGRDGAELVAAQLNPLGFAVAGVATRSSTYVQFPGQLHDIKAAIRWLRAHAAQYRLDPERIAIMGESSGGWTAAMAAVTGDHPALEGRVGVTGFSSRVQAAVPIYPPTDFLQMDAHMPDQGVAFNRILQITGGHADPRSPESVLIGCAIESCVERVQQANPVTYVQRDTPPCLILHGQRDLLVPAHQSELLYQALAAAGADATLIMLPQGEHGQWHEYCSDPAISAGALICSSQSELPYKSQPVELTWSTLIQFLHKHLRRQYNNKR